MILLYTGNGKGKTTAALGAALRATGYDWNVCVIQFMKSTWTTGEIAALKKIPNIELHRCGKGFYEILDLITSTSSQADATKDLFVAPLDQSSKPLQFHVRGHNLGA